MKYTDICRIVWHKDGVEVERLGGIRIYAWQELTEKQIDKLAEMAIDMAPFIPPPCKPKRKKRLPFFHKTIPS